MKKLTARQEEILQFIRDYIETNKFPPTVRETAENFQISVKGAHDHLKALEKKSCIRCNSKRSRAIELLDQTPRTELQTRSIPVLGHVAAGAPIFAEENYDGEICVPSGMLKAGKYFALKVKGDSMTDAGIRDGDMAVIHQQNTAENGDIIVAMIDESVTLKRFFLEKNRVMLKPENPAYHPIYTKDVQILGRLATIYRNYE
jgi:repressor LexA